MLRNRGNSKLTLAGAALAMLLTTAQTSVAQCTLGQPCGSNQCCQTDCNVWNCPPAYKHCQEGPPSIHILAGCPKPVCCPFDAPNWGYFQTCWRPYPWGQSWAHCQGVPPASQVPTQIPVHTAPNTSASFPSPVSSSPSTYSAIPTPVTSAPATYSAIPTPVTSVPAISSTIPFADVPSATNNVHSMPLQPGAGLPGQNPNPRSLAPQSILRPGN